MGPESMANQPRLSLRSGSNTASEVRPAPALGERQGRDRQILVVGDGFDATITAGFLDQTGLDPVLAATTDKSTRPDIVPIWMPGLILLERIGLRRPVEQLGTPLNRLECLTAGESWVAETGRRPPLVAIRRERLRTLIDRQLRGRIQTAERAVSAVEATDTGVRATFEQGIDELFDTVVIVDNSLVSTPVTESTVHTWEFEWPADVPRPGAATESWYPTKAAFSTPVSDGTHVRLVSTNRTRPAVAVSVEELDTEFKQLFEDLENPLTALDQHSVQYCQIQSTIPASLCRNGVSLVGEAARPLLLNGYIGPTLAIEDAWVLADALAYGPQDIDEALTNYDARRCRRINELLECESADVELETDLSPPLRQLARFRRLTFNHVFDHQLHEVAQTVPGCL